MWLGWKFYETITAFIDYSYNRYLNNELEDRHVPIDVN